MTSKKFNPLASLVMAAALTIGLTACGGSSTTPEPAQPPPPSDQETTADAAAAAAMAAKDASDAAAAAASGAETATMNLASLQTGEMARAHAESARDYAKKAMDAYMAAMTASDAAASAATGSAAGRELEKAEAAQAMAEEYAKKAADMAGMATEAAMIELHIDGSMKRAGDSSVDAMSGMVTSADGKMITGLLRGMEPARETAMVEGVPFARRTAESGKDTAYEQAVAAGTIKIGKVLDSTNDMARLHLITSYQGEKTVRVFVDGAIDLVPDIVGAATAATDAAPESGGLLVGGAIAAPAGMHYKAEHYSDATTAAPADTNLGAYDRVTVGAKGVPIFKLSNPDADTPPTPIYARRVATTTQAGDTTHTYRVVDIVADDSRPDGDDLNTDLDDLMVRASIPVAVEYSHIHFGAWNALGEADANGGQKVTDLGIAFVQSIGDGVTQRQGIGTATFKGDWVAAIKSMHSDAVMVDDGKAELTADFGKGTVKGDLDGLAMLEGTLSGNGFSGTEASDIAHESLDSSGTFTGAFSGNIYGADGSEAAGVFNFDGGDAGAFRGAFGGKDTDE